MQTLLLIFEKKNFSFVTAWQNFVGFWAVEERVLKFELFSFFGLLNNWTKIGIWMLKRKQVSKISAKIKKKTKFLFYKIYCDG